MTQTSDNVTWLTQEAYDRLKAERDHLAGDGRTEIAKKIEAARDEGDLRENGGYHAAKEEQGKMEARIRQLTQLLRDARVGEPPAAQEGVAGPGMVVTVRYSDGDEETFLIGSREEAAVTDMTVYSAQSPMGLALTGAKPGDSVTYTAPNGRDISVELKDVKPYAG